MQENQKEAEFLQILYDFERRNLELQVYVKKMKDKTIELEWKKMFKDGV